MRILIHLTLFTTVLMFGVLTLAQQNCADLFPSNHAEQDPNWLKDPNARKASGPEEQKYILNAQQTITDVFEKYFLSDEPNAFLEMIQQAHKVAALGNDLEPRPYQTSEYSSAEIFPGKTRYEVSKIESLAEGSPENSFGFLYNVKFVNDKFFPALSNFEHFNKAVNQLYTKLDFKKLKIGDQISFKINIYGHSFEIKAEVVELNSKTKQVEVAWTNNLHNFEFQKLGKSLEDQFATQGLYNYGTIGPVIAEVDGKKNVLSNTVSHQVPEPRFIMNYLNNGAKIMSGIKQLYKQRKTIDPRSLHQIDDKIAIALADYYQVMINAHPFVRINHSLLMNQVNYVLKSIGRDPLPHYGIDWLAMILNSQQFRILFH